MITDLTMVEQRHKAVLEVLEHGAKITDVAVRYGVDRKTIYRWLKATPHPRHHSPVDHSFFAFQPSL